MHGSALNPEGQSLFWSFPLNAIQDGLPCLSHWRRSEITSQLLNVARPSREVGVQASIKVDREDVRLPSGHLDGGRDVSLIVKAIVAFVLMTAAIKRFGWPCFAPSFFAVPYSTSTVCGCGPVLVPLLILALAQGMYCAYHNHALFDPRGRPGCFRCSGNVTTELPVPYNTAYVQ